MSARYFLAVVLVCLFSTSAYAGEALTIVGVDLYPSPGAEPLQGVNIEIEDGKISNIGQSRRGKLLDGKGLSASYGFWNSHVHFTQPRLEHDPQGVLNDMLLAYGFTQVLDTGSWLQQTLALKDMIEKGALRGPRIHTANGSLVYRHGTPAYLPEDLQLPEATSPALGADLVREFLGQGADGIKIFSGSFQSPTETIYLPVNVISAISDAAHAGDSFVVAHPTTLQGLAHAVEGGVDVIAHTTSSGSVIPAAILQQMQSSNVAVIPTLSLWRYEMMKHTGKKFIADAVENDAVVQLRQLLDADIEILFGTDVGYMTDYDTRREYLLMAKAGMDWPAIHQALTVAPARRFSSAAAIVEVGAPANLVLLKGDPGQDITALARVTHTIVDGEVMYSAP